MILRSLSKLLIKNNIPLSSSVEILKRSLVEAAEDGAPTDSLVSLRTGVHRKDVKRLRAALSEGASEKYPIKGLAMVLSVWANDTSFADSQGQPRRLQRTGSAKSPGFDDLVRTSKIDLAPATVLQELVAQDLVSIHPDGSIELLSTTFVAQSGVAALEAFEATVVDHIRIASDNVKAPAGAARYFDQVVRYSHLSAASVDALEAESRKLARAYLEHMNAMAHRLQSADDAAGNLADGRFVSGIYIAPRPPTEKAETDTTDRMPKKDARR